MKHIASSTFADQPQGEARGETTPFGTFPPNSFGLYDVHGNVWEWCSDNWHKNYEGAPVDGSAWITKYENDNKEASKLLRGGSWSYDPKYCRSADRRRDSPVNGYYDFGFRVVCGVAARTRWP